MNGQIRYGLSIQWNTIWQQEEIMYRYMLQYECTWKTVRQLKDPDKKDHTLYNAFMCNVHDRKPLGAACGYGWGRGVMGCEQVVFWGDKNVLNLDCGESYVIVMPDANSATPWQFVIWIKQICDNNSASSQISELLTNHVMSTLVLLFCHLNKCIHTLG